MYSRVSVYHKTLRTTATIVACMLVFESGILSESTKEISWLVHQQIATVVGIGASVEPNELNTLSSALNQRAEDLDRREREIDARARDTSVGSSASTYVLSAILFVLLVLITLNYALDILRYRAQRRSPIPMS